MAKSLLLLVIIVYCDRYFIVGSLIIIIMSLTPVSSSDEDIGGVPSMQSSYSAGMKRCAICMEESPL